MRLFSILLSKKRSSVNMESCRNRFAITDSEADNVLGGFREYKPSIYTKNESKLKLKAKELFFNINNPKHNS